MSEKLMKKSRVLLAALLGVATVAALTMWGCGTSGYDNPAQTVTTTKTATALIEPADLKQWIDEGKVNKAGGYDRVVVLEVNAATTNYDVIHIPGAQSVGLNSELSQTRVEGPMASGLLVPDGTSMDQLIQRLGIDANTTIVFTSSETESANAWNLTRGYTTFRYWGFPKNRLKVLNGGNKAWRAAGYAMSGNKPTISRSSYCVTPNNVNRVRTDFRASLSDMITAVTAGTATNDFIDGRSTDVPAAGPTADLIDPPATPTTTAKYVVFEGKVKGGRNKAHTLLHTAGKFKTIDEVKAALAIPATATHVYTVCRAGNIASVLFFAMDGYAYYNEVDSGILKPVWYDGSWGQWGLLASADKAGATTNAGGKLADKSVWDTTALTESLTYNVDAARAITNAALRMLTPEPSLSDGNQVEDADAVYQSPVIPTTGGAASGGGGGC